ncbi:MAG: transposase [Deltaproteobacteria bacterium]|nr:transposase [Deltaproteobacteria bacterium]
MQLTLAQARKPEKRHGGWRPGAGRPKKAGSISHDARPDEPGRYPQHVTLRIVEGVPSLARDGVMNAIRAAIRASHKPVTGAAQPIRGSAPTRVARARHSRGGFRIVEFNVLGNHVHLVVEAESKQALTSGMTGFVTRVARRINALLGRTGALFAGRYHARALKTPREVRNALRYVLLNRKHHAAEQRFTRTWIDSCSSAAWFTGWAQPIRADEPWKRELLGLPQPTAPPETWLLAVGWKRHGLLRFDERPG